VVVKHSRVWESIFIVGDYSNFPGTEYGSGMINNNTFAFTFSVNSDADGYYVFVPMC
jgi:hypothetical protein